MLLAHFDFYSCNYERSFYELCYLNGTNQKHMPTQNYTVNFLACAIGETYEALLPPFTFFALKSNPNAFVELVVRDPHAFLEAHGKALDGIASICGKHFMVRQFQHAQNKHIPNVYRFFEVPEVKATYTFITDVDIVVLDNIVAAYAPKWEGNIRPYINFVRPKAHRLTGVHFVHTERYYTNKMLDMQLAYYEQNKADNDEIVLYKLCARAHSILAKEHQWRKIGGIHFSPNRGAGKAMDLETTQRYSRLFTALARKHAALFALPQFAALVNQLKAFRIVD